MKKFLLFTLFVFPFSSALYAQQCIGTEPIITQVAEGSSQNKTVEIYNPSPMTIDMSDYVLERVANGGGAGNGANIALSGMVASGDVFVISNPGAEMSILNETDQLNSTISHNGNDSYILRRAIDNSIVDSYGNAGSSVDFGANMNMSRVLTGMNCPYDINPEDNFEPSDYNSVAYTTGFPAGLGSNPGFLPISLTHFNAKALNNQIQLNWRTETELNNDYMQIERAADGKSFEAIGKVKGAGTTLEAQVYTFIDGQPLKGANYYRLKQVDFDGTFEYHAVVVVKMNTDKSTNLFPTFVQDQLTAQAEGFAQVNIFNEAGQLVKSFSINGTESLNVSDLAAGTYHVVMEQNGVRDTQRFIKQ